MRAAVLDAKNTPLILRDVPTPEPRAGEARVRIHAAAINHRDLWIHKGQYAGLKYPIILGSDGCGVVEAVGPEVDRAWLGRRVVIDPALDWGDDPRAQRKRFRILGLPDDGTFAEGVCVPTTQLHDAPAHLSDAEAAALPLGGLTAYRAVVTQGELRAGQRVLVTGVGGGVATLALQIARALGAQVDVTSGSDEKLARAREAGATVGENYRAEGWVERLRTHAGEGYDLIIDSAGGPGFAQLIELARPGGRIVFYGATLGNPPGVDLRRVFWKQLRLQGTTMGTPAEFAAMLALYVEQTLRPVVDRVFALAEANEAFAHVEQAAQFGKVVFDVAG